MKSEPWVSVKPEIHLDLSKRISTSDILVSDLCDTDAPSPLKKVALSSLSKPEYWINPNFQKWNMKCIKNILKRKRKCSESQLGKQFIELFLRDQKILEEITKKYTPEFAESTFYPGVMEFYSLLPDDMIKFYVTRNIEEITQAYKQAAGFTAFMSEQFDKQKSMEELIKKHPERKRFILKGDSQEDEAALDCLKFSKRNKRIDEVLSIFVTDHPCSVNNKFDINIGKDYTKLVELYLR